MADGGNLPIGPGIWGFIAFFVLAVALWLLVRNMNARLRRMAYRDRERAEGAEGESDVLTEASTPADADRVHGPRADERPHHEDDGQPGGGAQPDAPDQPGGEPRD